MTLNSKLYYERALNLHLPVTYLDDLSTVKCELANRTYFFRGGFTPFNDGASNSLSNSKYCFNKLLEKSGFPVAKSVFIERADWPIVKKWPEKQLLQGLTYPLVAKPTLNTQGGKDVLCNIKNKQLLTEYLDKCFIEHPVMTLETFHPNLTAYRVLVFYNKVIGVVRREPASVMGDGIHTITELMAINNTKRALLNREMSLGDLVVDEEYLIRLEELGLSLEDIPTKNKVITLCYNCNASRGGTRVSLGRSICRENAKLACEAAKLLNLNIVGFDILCEDIEVPILQSRGIIVEANYHPDISLHEKPMYGTATPVSHIILKKLIYQHPVAYCFHLLHTKYFHLFVMIKSAFIVLLGITLASLML